MQWAYHMILPWSTFAILFAALYVRLIRANVMETLNEDYVRTARAKGAPEPQVIRSHVLRNSMLPVVTMLGMDIGLALGGAIFTESVFSLPGLGKAGVQSLENFDLPVIQGIVVFATLAIIIFNLVVDLLYAVIDPRIRLTLDEPPWPSSRSRTSDDSAPTTASSRRSTASVLGREGRDARDRRRVGLGQERHVPDDHGPEPTANRSPSGEALFNGEDLLAHDPRKLRTLRGNDIAMIFQDPMTSLNPVHSIGKQLVEAIMLHRDVTKRDAKRGRSSC